MSKSLADIITPISVAKYGIRLRTTMIIDSHNLMVSHVCGEARLSRSKIYGPADGI